MSTHKTAHGYVTFDRTSGGVYVLDALDTIVYRVILEPRNSYRDYRRKVGKLYVDPSGAMTLEANDGGYVDTGDYDSAARWIAWRELPEAEKREVEFLASLDIE